MLLCYCFDISSSPPVHPQGSVCPHKGSLLFLNRTLVALTIQLINNFSNIEKSLPIPPSIAVLIYYF